MWIKGVEAKNEYLMTNNYFPPSSRVQIESVNLGRENVYCPSICVCVYVYVCVVTILAPRDACDVYMGKMRTLLLTLMSSPPSITTPILLTALLLLLRYSIYACFHRHDFPILEMEAVISKTKQQEKPQC